jgi:S-DNA-T family DNA segregation ATPase FtsK/SpoIIIE
VCLNGFLVSILFKATPEQVKLLLIDPKRIELAIYSDLPHLVHPVVTDMALAKSALEWAMCEMDSRYEILQRLGVRNIEGYNQKLAEMGDKRPEEFVDLSPLPYLVIVIDELADLMMTSAKDVETCIVRLAQLARAAGIHMILATQRPSVDVVTGLIKANFPTRISFQVTSRHDSRTILDTVGAERLLGKGDMLYKSGGAKLRRLHGAYVDEAEIEAVVAHWKARQPQQFDLDFSEWRKDGEAGALGGGQGGGENATADDPMYAEAVEFVTSQGRASISLIQRRFRIGFNRAARYIEQMEADGLLGSADGSKPRTVMRGRE